MLQQLRKAVSSGTPWLTEDGEIRKITDFMDTPRFVMLAGGLTAAANLLGAELIVYTLFILTGCFLALFGRDFKSLLILVVCSYIAPSAKNNPGRQAASVFYPGHGGIYLMLLFAAFLGCMLYRLLKDPQLGKKNLLHCKRSLLRGMLILGAGYVLAGAFSGRYFEHGIMNLVFAVMQFLSVTLIYWLFSATIRWDKVQPDYLAWVGLVVGLTVCAETVSLFITNHVIQNGTIRTALIYTGWGNANNIGCMIAMMVPFAVYLGRKTGKAWLFSILAAVMAIFVCLTCSRASIIAVVVIYIASVIVVLKGISNKTAKKAFLLFNGIIALILLILSIIFHQRLILMFQELLSRGINPRDRQFIYPEGIRTFLRYPIFGESFYPSSDVIFQWSYLPTMRAILPARWHNTVIQLLASCGIVGLLCYSFHRWETIRLFWKKRNTSTIFTGLVIAALLLMSLLDCHFFNIGPTLFYSAALAYAEYANEETLYTI